MVVLPAKVVSDTVARAAVGLDPAFSCFSTLKHLLPSTSRQERAKRSPKNLVPLCGTIEVGQTLTRAQARLLLSSVHVFFRFDVFVLFFVFSLCGVSLFCVCVICVCVCVCI